MHGYFVDNRLWHKARALAEPFAYDTYRAQRVQEKLEQERKSRIGVVKKLPKVSTPHHGVDVCISFCPFCSSHTLMLSTNCPRSLPSHACCDCDLDWNNLPMKPKEYSSCNRSLNRSASHALVLSRNCLRSVSHDRTACGSLHASWQQKRLCSHCCGSLMHILSCPTT